MSSGDSNNEPVVLSIAGWDPTTGAGVGADLKVFSAMGVSGMGVVTAVTSQGVNSVTSVSSLPPGEVSSQIKTLSSGLRISAVKIGMIPSKSVARVVANWLKHLSVPVVLDPVLNSGTGRPLVKRGTLEEIKKKLFPFVRIVTPNIDEAQVLTGTMVRGIDDMKRTAEEIHNMGPSMVLIKGGHIEGDPADVFYDGKDFSVFKAERQGDRRIHGAGCALSSAIASLLALGTEPLKSVEKASKSVREWISAGFLPYPEGPLYLKIIREKI